MPSPSQKFNILYSGDLREDVINLSEYIEDFYKGVGASQVDINLNALLGVVGSITQKFPSPIGSDQASPFKKVAAFTMSPVVSKPASRGRIKTGHFEVRAS